MSLYTVVFFTGSYLCITVATVLQEQFGTCNDHLNHQCLRLMIHVCTDHKQVQDLHLKNQLNRGYNKLPKKINKAFLFNKVFKKLDHSKVFVQFISMSINNNIGEYNTTTFIYISWLFSLLSLFLCHEGHQEE
jgi:hypothetical protein